MVKRRWFGRGAALLSGGLVAGLLLPAVTAHAAATRYEAENATISQGAVASNHTGFSGTGFVDYTNVTGSYVEFTVNASSAGTATLSLRYANGTTVNRPMTITVNGTTIATATVAPLKYKVNVDTLEHTAAERLQLNDIGVCELQLDRPVVFESYAENRDLGGVILIDRLTNHTVGAGLLHFALRRSANVRPQVFDVNKQVRSSQKGQRAGVVWLTGLSGAGKSTIANLAEEKLVARGRHTYLLDGDNVRRGLNKDLGFTEQDRVENIRRVAEVARLMVDAGLIVLVAFISPFRAERRTARDLFEPGEFVEVYVATPIAVAEARDPKGLYKKARRGDLKNFTGIDSPYETPEAPEIHIDTTQLTSEAAADMIVAYLADGGFLGGG